jgi:hypothetical protein
LVAFANPIEESAPEKFPVPSLIEVITLVGGQMDAAGVGDHASGSGTLKNTIGNGDIGDAGRIGKALDNNWLSG